MTNKENLQRKTEEQLIQFIWGCFGQCSTLQVNAMKSWLHCKGLDGIEWIDKLRRMSVDELGALTQFWKQNACMYCADEKCTNCAAGIKMWLLSEVD